MEPIILNSSKSNQIKNALINEKLTEDSVTEERVITWLDAKKVCFLNRTKVNLNEKWVYVGDAETEEFKNTEESSKLLKSSMLEPFLTAVLTVWENNSIKSTEENI